MKPSATIQPSPTITINDPNAAIVVAGFPTGSHVLFTIYFPSDAQYFFNQPGIVADTNGAGALPLYPAQGGQFFTEPGNYKVDTQSWDYSKSPPHHTVGPSVLFTVQS